MGFAHRGAPAWYQRENTLAAFNRALAFGASGLESDAWLAADGVPVLHHDGEFGPPGLRRSVPALSSGALPGWLPTLPALYQQLGTEFELSLDIKAPAGHAADATTTAVLAAARAAGGVAAVRRLWLCGPLGSLRAWRELDADVRLVNSASVRDIREAGGIGPYTRELRAAGVAALNLRAREWAAPTAAIARVLHDHELLAFGWDVQRPPTLARLLGYGLDGVYSDHVDRLVAATGRRAG
ncbi:glycerophosphodiester phosphodiesterase [Frankia sp. CNm7]|uniref:Glycerophosphodiester phosphodiesterase n=1 Tax=Frankia nepalensis TaxID=1836974 RepID=A0A937UT43_9ACTN|nr:glycerophosphodiester phosphodiesterase [Frankia nepalensis]MBL7511766.1 glycerophosphodiester phosphodiesterase [Frankia nepalensis]MBL7521963.1 glycerophosphodiester phosphodiesterase [Frankia nepalensis]MBL7633182.1 glycerophosphodiester phosphodiesterase [Frankia nepalensis]